MGPSQSVVKVVLFDFGGTLLSYNREEIFRALLEEKGVSVSWENVSRAYELIEPEWYNQFENQPVTDETLELLDLKVLENLGIEMNNKSLAHYITKNWWRMEQQLPQSLVRKPYSDAPPCLRQIRRLGLEMGIVSNIESEERLRKELELIGLSEFFRVLVASGTVGWAKPARQIFDTAADLLGLERRKILFVGDDLERDYQGALGAGMRPALIDRTTRFEGRTDLVRLSSLEEVPRLLRGETR